MGNYFGAAEEARYLTGMAAARRPSRGEIGYVAAFPIPEVLRGINAFTLGARSVNPDATVAGRVDLHLVRPRGGEAGGRSRCWTPASTSSPSTRTRPPRVRPPRRQGGQVGRLQRRHERFAPDAWLTAPVWDWGPYYIEDRPRPSGRHLGVRAYYGNMADGMVNIAPFGESVPEDETAVSDRRPPGEIIDGEFAPFTGPIAAQDGTEKVADGEDATLEELLSMDYFVEGVIGERRRLARRVRRPPLGPRGSARTAGAIPSPSGREGFTQAVPRGGRQRRRRPLRPPRRGAHAARRERGRARARWQQS
jgi:basic membrane protein A and related proteins